MAWPGKNEEKADANRALQVQPRLALFYPSLYQPWAAAVGFPHQLLLSTMALQQDLQHAESSAARAATHAGDLRITFPGEGEIFKIDPVLRPEFQTL